MKIKLIIIALIGISFKIKAQEKIQTETGLKNDFIYKNGNVGIGTNNPEAKFHVFGGGTNIIIGDNNNSLMPALKLWGGHSTGYAYIQSGGVALSKLRISKYQTTSGNLDDFQIYSTQTYFSGTIGIGTTNYSTKLSIKNGNTKFIGFERIGLEKKAHIGYGTANDGGIYLGTDDNQYTLWVQQNGNVGIGTYNPGIWKLAVNGKIRAKEIKVETGWSDFVFYENYKLPTLQEVESHIKEKGHLKDIPSESEVKENGILLGEMDSKLLQKIEELTLYIIQQDKKIIEQAKKIEKLETFEKKLLKLQKRLEKLESR
ncbi:hypothetical protein [Flammeovirga sp. OC4]|uniref:hypothetical protein n=1 Tax=Flammeovirga sp. OC4 TaxID=1382345 RepID=UPI0006936071|nr:hypothetical protein [Flammeovirga sp. OC4]